LALQTVQVQNSGKAMATHWWQKETFVLGQIYLSKMATVLSAIRKQGRSVKRSRSLHDGQLQTQQVLGKFLELAKQKFGMLDIASSGADHVRKMSSIEVEEDQSHKIISVMRRISTTVLRSSPS
jgi:hypothetical protein